MAPGALQLHGLPPPRAQARTSDPRPQKIWDSTLALCGMPYAKRQGDAIFRRYHDTIFERFWKRELDIEDPGVIGGVLAEAGADPAGFPDYSAGPGRAELDSTCRAAEAIGVFGVPTFVLDGELFWGREHLPDIREMLGATAQLAPRLRRPPGTAQIDNGGSGNEQ